MANDISALIEPFIRDYEASLRSNNQMGWHKRKSLAFKYAADKWFPQEDIAGRVRQAMADNMTGKQTDPTVWKMSWELSKAVRRVKRDIRNTPSKMPESVIEPVVEPIVEQVAEQTQERRSMASLYRAWVEMRDYVPADSVISHFSGYDTTTLGNCRAKLIKEGYKFAKVGSPTNGWQVTERPVVSQPEPEIELSAKDMATLKAILSNPKLMAALKA